MKSKLLLVIAAMFIAATAFAQPANITWWIGLDPVTQELYPLMTNCDGTGDPLPDGRRIVAYWDANDNGPDAADQPWPIANCNYNELEMNSAMGPGTFTQLEAIWIVFNPPAAPNNKYYLVVFCADGTTPQYITQRREVTPGPYDHFWWLPSDYYPCQPCAAPWVCPPQQIAILTPPTGWNVNVPLGVYQCVHLCYSSPVVTVVVPVFNASNIPHVNVIPGCLRPGECYEPDCPPAVGRLTTWQYNGTSNPPTYVALLHLEGAEGCVCLWLDYIEPAEISNFSAVARDASVELSWNSNFADFDHFEITRSDNVVFTTTENRYTDNTAENGTTYTYSIVAVSVSGARSDAYTSNAVTPSMRNAVITEYKLHQNFPNPFNPSTQIRFDLVENNFVSLKVYNAAGQEVATLVNGMRDKGVNLVEFDANSLTSGLYFYTVKIGNEYSATKKMLLVK